MWCKHNWVRIAVTYAPPTDGKVEGVNLAVFEKFYKGVTTILWECSLCKEIRKEEMLGKQVEGGSNETE